MSLMPPTKLKSKSRTYWIVANIEFHQFNFSKFLYHFPEVIYDETRPQFAKLKFCETSILVYPTGKIKIWAHNFQELNDTLLKFEREYKARVEKK